MPTLPEWMPEIVQERVDKMGYKSVREIERKAGLSNGAIKYLHNANGVAIGTLVKYLKALGYTCDSPEFEVVNQICSQNIETDCRKIATISPSTNETQNLTVLYIQKSFGEAKQCA